MINEAIILAGGLGTRLSRIIPDKPKPMANINNKPFLEYIFNYLKENNINRVILSVGYKSEIIKNYFGENWKNIKIIYSEENEPLGTGGAIKQALKFVKNNDVFILNGDTFFNINLKEFYKNHKNKNSKLSISLKFLQNIQRFGTVKIDENNKIIGFEEKKFKESGLINGGIYILEIKNFIKHNFPNKFSFEEDYLSKYYNNDDFFGFTFNNYFIDIGIPHDYERANKEFNLKIDKSWTLFLDRDGVINKKIEGDYVKNWKEFEFIPKVKKGLRKLSKYFGRTIIITNQRGIGKGVMTIEDLTKIHKKLIKILKKKGIIINKIYFCPHDYEKEECDCRKPKIGLAMQAKKDFNEIDFSKTIVIGDSESDIQFGKNIKAVTVFINQEKYYYDADYNFSSINEFAKFIKIINLN